MGCSLLVLLSNVARDVAHQYVLIMRCTDAFVQQLFHTPTQRVGVACTSCIVDLAVRPPWICYAQFGTRPLYFVDRCTPTPWIVGRKYFRFENYPPALALCTPTPGLLVAHRGLGHTGYTQRLGRASWWPATSTVGELPPWAGLRWQLLGHVVGPCGWCCVQLRQVAR